MAAPFYIPARHAQRFQVLHVLTNNLSFPFFKKITALLSSVKWVSHCVVFPAKYFSATHPLSIAPLGDPVHWDCYNCSLQDTDLWAYAPPRADSCAGVGCVRGEHLRGGVHTRRGARPWPWGWGRGAHGLQASAVLPPSLQPCASFSNASPCFNFQGSVSELSTAQDHREPYTDQVTFLGSLVSI